VWSSSTGRRPISPLYLPYISPISPLYLPYIFYWQAADVPRGVVRHRGGKPAEAKRILPGEEEPLELWASDAVQQVRGRVRIRA